MLDVLDAGQLERIDPGSGMVDIGFTAPDVADARFESLPEGTIRGGHAGFSPGRRGSRKGAKTQRKRRKTKILFLLCCSLRLCVFARTSSSCKADHRRLGLFVHHRGYVGNQKTFAKSGRSWLSSRRAIWAYSSLSSMPTKSQPSRAAAIPVRPEPAKGSRMSGGRGSAW